jgi:hydroxymethylbilane synthase
MSLSINSIHVGARESPLSQIQYHEVLRELRQYHPDVHFEPLFVKSTGDIDKKTSLRTLNKTDFFTKEIDEMVLKGECRIGIHSAKDLPEPLTAGLKMIALTKGVDPADVIVLKSHATPDTLPTPIVVATSSERREESVRQLWPTRECHFIDLRGTIGERLAILENGKVDGVVIAEAALIRLGLTHLNRVRLPGPTAHRQGQLAIIAREDDLEMEQLFASIHYGETLCECY